MPRLTPIHWRRLVCVFEKEGFVVVRRHGDHVIMSGANSPRPIVIPQVRDLPVFVIRNNLRAAGMDRERYFELLSDC